MFPCISEQSWCNSLKTYSKEKEKQEGRSCRLKKKRSLKEKNKIKEKNVIGRVFFGFLFKDSIKSNLFGFFVLKILVKFFTFFNFWNLKKMRKKNLFHKMKNISFKKKENKNLKTF